MQHLEAVWRLEEEDWRAQPQCRDVEVRRHAHLLQPNNEIFRYNGGDEKFKRGERTEKTTQA